MIFATVDHHPSRVDRERRFAFHTFGRWTIASLTAMAAACLPSEVTGQGGIAYTTRGEYGGIERLNTQSEVLTTVVPASPSVTGVGINASGSVAYTFGLRSDLAAGQLSAVDLASGKVTSIADDLPRPPALSSLGGNHLSLVPRSGNRDEVLTVIATDEAIIEVDLGTGQPRVIHTLAASVVRVSPDGNRVYALPDFITTGGFNVVVVLDRASGHPIRTLEPFGGTTPGGIATGFAIDSAEQLLYGTQAFASQHHVFKYDLASEAIISTHSVSSSGQPITASALDEPRQILHLVQPQNMGTLVAWNTSSGNVQESRRLLPSELGFSGPIAISPDGTALYLSGEDIFGLWRIDVATGQIRSGDGNVDRPVALARAADTGEIFVLDRRGLAWMDEDNGVLSRIVDVTGDPWALAGGIRSFDVLRDGLTCYASRDGVGLLRINLADGTTEPLAAGLTLSGPNLVVSSDETSLYGLGCCVGGSSVVMKVDLSSTPVQATQVAAHSGVPLGLSSDETALYTYTRSANQVDVIDIATGNTTKSVSLVSPGSFHSMVLDPSLRHAHGTVNRSVADGGGVYYIDLATGAATRIAELDRPRAFVYLNTADGSNISVQPVDTITGEQNVTLTFNNITSPGDTTVTSSTTGFDPPTGFQVGDGQLYFDITTTASYDGQITLCIDYSSTEYIDGSNLFLFHYRNGSWRNITTSVDTTSQIICGKTNSLSPFAVFELQPGLTAAGLLEMLVDDVAILNLQHGINNSLDAKLDRALDALDKARNNHETQAVNALEAFINAVEAQSGHMIPAGAAASLVDTALIVIELIQNG